MSVTDTAVAPPAPTERPAARRRPSGEALAVAVALAVALVAHGYMALGATGPVWMDDEVGYILNAAYLAGVDLPPLSSLGYWGGWSLSLVPLFWLGLPPATVYAAAVALSALYGALAVLPAHVLARNLGAPPVAAAVTAAVVATVPTRTVLSNYALAENALVLTVLVAAACAARAVTADGPARARVWWVATAVSSVLAFMIHGRAVTIVGAAVLVGLGLLVRRSGRMAGVLVLAVSGGGAVAVYTFNSWLVSVVYGGASGSREDPLLSRLLALEPYRLLLPASGQAWYQVAAWGGLTLAGAAVVLVGALTGLRRLDDAFLRDLYILSAGTATALISLTSVVRSTTRGSDRMDVYFYGRYVSHITAVLAVVGLVWLLTRARRRHVAILVGSCAVVSAVFLTRGGTYGDVGRPFPPINVPGVTTFPWPALSDVPQRPTLWLSLVGLAIPVLVLLLRRRPWLVAAVLLPLTLLGTVSAAWFTVDRFDAGPRNQALSLRQTLAQIDEETLVVSDVPGFHRNGYTFWSRTPVRVIPRDAALDVDADEALIVKPDDERLAGTGARRVACERSGPVCLYLVPGPLQAQARQDGLLAVPEGDAPPPAAREGEVDVVDVRRVPWADGVEILVRVRHTGSGAPWAALFTQEDPAGVVRVLAEWEGGFVPADLPRTLVPGDEALVRVRLPDVPEGTVVSLRLMVEGMPDVRFRDGGTQVTV